MSDKLYQDILMDHFSYPRNKKELENADFASGQFNPSCGDKVSIFGKIYKDNISGDLRVKELTFLGSGCVISQATASMLTQYCKDKKLEDILALNKDDILNLIKISLGPTRLRCALLSLESLKTAIKEYLEKNK